jgi:hypothetical protein
MPARDIYESPHACHNVIHPWTSVAENHQQQENWPRLQNAKRSREEVIEFDTVQEIQNHKRIKLSSTSSMILTIKTMSGSTAEMDIKPEWSVLHLKHEIEEYFGIPTHEQRLIYSGRSLVDSHALSNYDIRNGAVVVMVLLMHGG